MQTLRILLLLCVVASYQLAKTDNLNIPSLLTTQITNDKGVIDLGARCNELSNEKIARVTFLFAHGLRQRKGDVVRYAPLPERSQAEQWYLITCPYLAFDFSEDVSERFGQKEDIEALRSAITTIKKAHYTKAVLQKNEKDLYEEIVVIGNSRGAVTALNLLGQYPDKKTYIKALVLEASADTIESMKVPDSVLSTGYWADVFSFSSDIVTLDPIDVAKNINKETPILLVHAKDDSVVPINRSRKLYQELRKSGHEHVYFFELDTAVHANYQSSPSAEAYQTVVHAFYKKYNIPHDPALATKGEPLLEQSQPPLWLVEQRITS